MVTKKQSKIRLGVLDKIQKARDKHGDAAVRKELERIFNKKRKSR